MGARMRAFDWASTPLGAPDHWPQSLKTIVRVMLDSRYAMWMLWGPELTFFCNDAYLPTVGIKRDWVLGARSDRVWEEIWPEIGPRIEQVLAEGKATWDEALLLYLERSGYPEETYHTFSYSPVYDDDNQVAGMLCVVTEVTERVIGERRLSVLHALGMRSGVEGVEDCGRRLCQVLARHPLDVPFAALYLTPAQGQGLRRVAATAEWPEGGLPETVDPHAPPGPWDLERLAAGQETRVVADLPARGVRIPFVVAPDLLRTGVMLPLKASGAQLLGALVLGCSPRRALDADYRSFLELVARQCASAIAEAQAYEAERKRAEALAELDRAKTAFFSNVSHEFRTPLTLMLAPIEEAMADERLPQAARERLGIAQRNADRLRRLVNSLLDFSRIEAGRVEAVYEETDLATLTRDLASTFRSAMERAGLRYVVECGGLDEAVFVDRDMWEKIVLNLLSNAFKFTFDGAVCVRLEQRGGEAVLEVEDSGTGIAAHQIPRLFERFHRVEGARGRTHEGSGIGLALVQELVKLHGGRIEAESAEGRGSRFRVHLPLGTAHLPPERLRRRESAPRNLLGARVYVEEALSWLPTDTLPEKPLARVDEPISVADRRFASTFGARLVIADDNADMRAYLRELLGASYRVEALADGEQALLAARRERPDLILSDVMMPRLDGFGLLAEVRRDAALAHVPVVLLSARAGQEARIEGLDAGADDYLIKPFSARELLARIGALLELRRMRRAAEEAFRLRQEQFETLLNEAPMGVFLVDGALRIREANPTARAAFPPVPQVIGLPLEELLHRAWAPDYANEVVGLFQHTLTTGTPFVAAERGQPRRDRGVTEYYEWRIHRIPLPEGGQGVVCYFRDVSLHVENRKRLEAADQQKDQFLAMLAHELRNPLAPIRTAGELLARIAGADPLARQAAHVVQRQATNLGRLVDDLLDVSRITHGRVQLQRRAVDLDDVVAQAVEVVAPLFDEKQHRVVITQGHGAIVHADPARLVQCVGNLLTNAAKYTDPGGRISVGVSVRGREACVVVRDDGIGIPAELQPKIFDLFVQGERTLDRADGGLGIGLSVVRRLVEMHGGRIQVSSDGVGRGAAFEIVLPLVVAQPAKPGDEGAPGLAPMRILVVDDNEDAAVSIAMVLGLDGHRVETAHAPREALARASRFRPDLALLDIGLPEMDGYELARRLRELPGLSGIYLVALTGYAQSGDKESARQAGFHQHLVKPAGMDALQAVLRAAQVRDLES
jgi:signal transduction histidine kinase